MYYKYIYTYVYVRRYVFRSNNSFWFYDEYRYKLFKIEE